MLPTPHRSPRTSIPATGLGSILVAAPRLALVADRGVVARAAVAVAVAVGDEGRPSVGGGPAPSGTRPGAGDTTARTEHGR